MIKTHNLIEFESQGTRFWWNQWIKKKNPKSLCVCVWSKYHHHWFINIWILYCFYWFIMYVFVSSSIQYIYIVNFNCIDHSTRIKVKIRIKKKKLFSLVDSFVCLCMYVCVSSKHLVNLSPKKKLVDMKQKPCNHFFLDVRKKSLGLVVFHLNWGLWKLNSEIYSNTTNGTYNWKIENIKSQDKMSKQINGTIINKRENQIVFLSFFLFVTIVNFIFCFQPNRIKFEEKKFVYL